MTNYYEELKLDQNASPAELMEELVKLEAVWHKRELARPDAAAAKLVLITEAKKVFASAAAKAKYDRELFAAPAEETPEDPDAARRAQYERWYGDAQAYYDSAQYDLAKTAVEKAMGYVSGGDDDPDFYELAASIYRQNGDTSTAMTYINRAIVQQPDEAEYYISKALIYEQQYLAACQNRYNGNAESFSTQERDALRRAEAVAAQAGNGDAQGRAMGYRAFSLYNHTRKDEAEAERLAEEAVRIGDRWGNAQNVLDAINAKREASEKAAQAAAREAAERAEKQRRAEAEQRHRQEQAEKAAQERREAEEAAKRRFKQLYGLGATCVILAFAGMALSIAACFAVAAEAIKPIPVALLVPIELLSVGLLNFGNCLPYGDVDGWVRWVGGIFNLICAMMLMSAYWFLFNDWQDCWLWGGILLLTLFAAVFLARWIAKSIYKSNKSK